MLPERESSLIDQAAYRFQIALTDAIESYVRELRRIQYRALTYRGADLGRAIAIELYFRLVNDRQLLDAYRRHLAGERISQEQDEIPLSAVAYWIFRQILRRPPQGYLHRRLKAYAKLSYTMGRAHLADAGKSSGQQNDIILILALSKRFFEYLLPIRRALEAQVRWLVPAGSVWTRDAIADGETFVTFGHAASLTARGPLTAPLAAHWSELAFRFDEFQQILETIKPKAIVLTEGNQTNDEMLARAAQSAGVRSVCIQQGWSPIIHAGFRSMHFDKFCAWGPEFARLLQPHNRQQAFAATGSHRIGPSIARPVSEKAVAFFLQNNSLLITRRAWEEMLDFILWAAQEWPARPILVREHPAEPLTVQEAARLSQASNIQFCRSASVSLDDVLRQAEIAVAFYSTTLVEALARGTVPLIINITGAPHYSPDLAALGAGIEVRDFIGARNAMSRLLTGGSETLRQRIPSLVPRFFAHATDAALSNIAAAITTRS